MSKNISSKKKRKKIVAALTNPGNCRALIVIIDQQSHVSSRDHIVHLVDQFLSLYTQARPLSEIPSIGTPTPVVAGHTEYVLHFDQQTAVAV